MQITYESLLCLCSVWVRRFHNLARDLLSAFGYAVAISANRHNPESDLRDPANMSRTGGLRSGSNDRNPQRRRGEVERQDISC